MSSIEKTLHCVLKKEWFDKIASGEKTHEYRIAKEYWFTRIYEMYTINPYTGKKTKITSLTPFVDKVKFTLGMTSDPEKVMLFEIKKITEVDGKNTDLKHDGLVYDIELGRRLQ